MSNKTSVLALAAGATLSVASMASASLITLNDVLVYKGQAVPGPQGAAGVVYGNLGSVSIDDSGRVTTSTVMTGGNIAASQNRGMFHGTTAADFAFAAQSGTQAPGLPAGALMQTSTGSSAGLSTSSFRIAANGTMLFVSTFTGGGATLNVNDSAVFTGTAAGGFAPLVRRGDTVPGTSGAIFSTTFDTSLQNMVLDNSGRAYFKQTMTGGDVSGTTNNTGVFMASSSGITTIARKGNAAPGAGLGVAYNAIGFITQANANGQFLYDTSLSGSVTTATDNALYIHTPGSGSTLLAREGVTVLTGGATYSGSGTVPGTCFNNSGRAAVNLGLTGGDVVAGVNDNATFIMSSSGRTLAVRKGDVAPGTDGTFTSLSANASMRYTNSGQLAFNGIITGGTTTAANDTGMWVSAPGNASALSLILREGDAALGTNGAAYDGFNSNFFAINAQGQMLIQVSLTGGDVVQGVNSSAFYLYDPAASQKLALYFRQGDQVEISPGVFKTITGSGGVQFPNGNGAQLSFNDAGQFVVRLNTTDGTDVVVSGRVPAPGAASALSLLGLAAMGRRRRAV